MNKRILLAAALVAMAITVVAVPAKRIQRTLTLADGTTVEAVFTGDEFNHYWLADDGTQYVHQGDGIFVERSQTLQARALGKAMRVNQRRVSRRRASYTGEKKGLVILMSFKDKSFSSTKDDWEAAINEKGYSRNGAPGSVADYFYDQSSGQFQLSFDVLGPYEAAHNYSYYGQNDIYGDDINVGELVVEACEAVKGQVNFSDYDWDGDGYVDQVFILYAGYGENTTGVDDDAIWPHEYYLQYYDDYWDTGYQIENGIWINTYACSCELSGNRGKALDGIGTICHEFSHCLGLPDFYSSSSSNTSHTAWDWDLLDYGSYNDDGWCPPNFNAYERYFCGWLDPIELTQPQTVILSPLNESNTAYRISNDADSDEYYLLENRQQNGWDASLPGEGLLIFHVDFDQDAWDANTPNASNSHPRMAPISASGRYGLYNSYTYAYPYQKKDSLTDNSSPAFSWFNADSRTLKTSGMSVTNITQNDDETVTFDFGNATYTRIYQPTVSDANATAYDLTGRKANAATRIVIQNGKKRFNKYQH